MKQKTPQFLKKTEHLISIAGCIICLGILYSTMFKSLVYDWINLPDFSHGFFIPLISLYVVWERIDKLNNAPIKPSNYGLGIIFLGLVFFFVGNLGGESFSLRFSFLIVLTGIVVFLLGWDVFKILLFPILFLIFMIPLPSVIMVKITFPMQLFASNVAEQSLQLFGIPVLREGNVIHLADTSLEVAEACSGIRSLISLLALGTIFAYFTKNILWQKTLLICLCFPIAIFVNAFRVSATGILANYYGISVAQGFFHDFSGYILFIAAFVLMVISGFLLSLLEKLFI